MYRDGRPSVSRASSRLFKEVRWISYCVLPESIRSKSGFNDLLPRATEVNPVFPYSARAQIGQLEERLRPDAELVLWVTECTLINPDRS